MFIRVISWFMSFLWMVMRGGLPLSSSLPLLVCLFLSCAQPTDSTDEGTVERERVEVSGSITEDAVWESGKEYLVTGDVIVEVGATLTIQPDVVGKFTPLEKASSFRAEIRTRNKWFGRDLKLLPNFLTGFAHERADEYYGIMVEGTLMADGGDSTRAILFTSGAAEWARKPGNWRG